MSATIALIEAQRARFNVWLCRRFGHKRPFISGPWNRQSGTIFGTVKTRPERCSRCRAEFCYWTTNLAEGEKNWRRRMPVIEYIGRRIMATGADRRP